MVDLVAEIRLALNELDRFGIELLNDRGASTHADVMEDELLVSASNSTSICAAEIESGSVRDLAGPARKPSTLLPSTFTW